MGTDLPLIRRERLRSVIDAAGSISVREAMDLLEVSEMTVRRDLALLAGDGQVELTRGGAAAVGRLAPDADFAQRVDRNVAPKRRLAQRALAEVEDDDVLFVSGGTTCLELARQLRGTRRCTVVTNSLPVVAELAADPAIQVMAVGGWAGPDNDMTGNLAERTIRGMRAGKAFIGATGIVPAGVFNANAGRAAVDIEMAANALATYVLADSSKVGQVALVKVAGLGDLAAVVSDTAPPAEARGWFADAGVPVLWPEEETA
ncbi:DeoR/GlpR family DNA-binding transcription regulator [Sinomonas halotolerans]|uniref:Lactose phosphotransferase system repressor n=1 Tax=Sinomonas halotolerans TaxID=1644133 RepID=A0ABU9X320_9MICC